MSYMGHLPDWVQHSMVGLLVKVLAQLVSSGFRHKLRKARNTPYSMTEQCLLVMTMMASSASSA